jgi:hypothetical protein
MKKLLVLICILFLFVACKKSLESTKADLVDTPKKHVKTDFSNCNECSDLSPPTIYTGLDDQYIDMTPGFGLFTDSAYDAGWAEGYKDAAFYVNRAATTAQLCDYVMKVKIGFGVNSSKLVDIDYQKQSGEVVLGLALVRTCAQSNWLLVRCNLRSSCEAQSLGDQYEFNDRYTNKTRKQSAFDKARYTAFTNYTTHEPLAPPPGP